MKILFTGVKSEEEAHIEKLAQAQLSDHEIVLRTKSELDSLSDRDKQAEVLSVFVASEVSQESLEEYPNIKFITTRSTGYDHIDLEYAKSKGIEVANVPAYGSETVAEFTFALILELSRKVCKAYEQVREEGDFSPDALQGFDLEEKILGVIGTGKIGEKVIKIGRGFGMKVIAHDAYPDANLSEDLGFPYLDKEKVLRQADIVTLHVPYMQSTHHLIDDEALAMMKPGSYLVNTSRGAVIDTESLVRHLQDGSIAGAALDVLEEEEFTHDEANALLEKVNENHDLKDVIANHVLIDMPNVIVTPHVAYNTQEAVKRIIDTTFSNITSFISGTPQNLVE